MNSIWFSQKMGELKSLENGGEESSVACGEWGRARNALQEDVSPASCLIGSLFPKMVMGSVDTVLYVSLCISDIA